ncbi:DJ-1/PfpI family protein [Aspergillus carlsbadensis]|nr:DJ-1/PfpI family protein [Aspergillus carlsbadensis]
MSLLDLRNPGRPIHVGVILFNTLTEHLDVAPIGYFSTISRSFLENAPPGLFPEELKRQTPDFAFHWVTEDGETPGNLTGNMKVIPTDSFTTCPPLDIIIIGAMGGTTYTPSETELTFLRKSYEHCTALLLICAGFQPALAAGLLQGKTATAPRPMLAMVKQMAPGTNWVEKRYVRDGKIWTTGSLLNGFDMVAAFGRESWGGEGSLLEGFVVEGAWPDRDVDYKDVGGWGV